MITKEPKIPGPASLSNTKVNTLNTKPGVVCQTVSVTADEQDHSSSRGAVTPALEEASTEPSPNRCVCPGNTKVEADMGKSAFVQMEGALREPGSMQLQTGLHKELAQPPAPETVSVVDSFTAATALPHAVIGKGNYHIHNLH